MAYNVTVVSGNSYDIKVSTTRLVSSVEVDNTPKIESLSEIGDVDTSNISNNYVMIYDSATKTHKFIAPSKILDLADGVDNDSIDYGIY